MTALSGASRRPLLAALLLGCSGPNAKAAGTALTSPGSTLDTALQLELVQEKKLDKLLSGALDHYEASGVAVFGGELYVVLDDSTSIVTVDTDLGKGTLGPGESAPSQYEAISATEDGFYVMVETLSKDDPRGQVVTLDATAAVVGTAFTDTSFPNYNQGFEGVAWLRSAGTDYLLALCETNDCAGSDAPLGHGRLHLLALQSGTWVTELVLEIPSDVTFANFSDLALLDTGNGTYRVAVLSRQSSALWLGTLTTNPWSISATGTFYGFPEPDGDVRYCALEGITFLGPRSLALVSDASNGDKPCNSEDESIHLFQLPD